MAALASQETPLHPVSKSAILPRWYTNVTAYLSPSGHLHF